MSLMSFCVSVYRQSKNQLRSLPTIQCTALLLLNRCIHSTAAPRVSMALGDRLQQTQKGASIPASRTDLISLALRFWDENNIWGIRFSVLKERFTLQC